jgi:hypothetical protein
MPFVAPSLSFVKASAHPGRRITPSANPPYGPNMQLSDNCDDFIRKLDRIEPRFGDTSPLPFEAPKEKPERLYEVAD